MMGPEKLRSLSFRVANSLTHGQNGGFQPVEFNQVPKVSTFEFSASKNMQPPTLGQGTLL